MGIDKYNAEGYYDPTTYNALTNIHRDEMAGDKRLPLIRWYIFVALMQEIR